MICNGSVTVFKLNGGAWQKSRFDRAAVSGGRRVLLQSGGDRLGGRIVIRIPTSDALDISLGDRVVMGHATTDAPAGGSFRVTEVRDNRRGMKKMHHYRLVVE